MAKMVTKAAGISPRFSKSLARRRLRPTRSPRTNKQRRCVATGFIDPAIWAEVVDLNLTANWRLIQAMDPLLRAAPAGRAIFVTSGVARGVFPYWGPYVVSKAGLETLVKIYAGEIAKTRVRANLIDPDIVRTRLRARAFPGEDPSRLPPPESVANAFLALALPECAHNGELVMASAPSP